MVGERAEVCGWGDLTCSVVCRMCDVCCVFGMFEVFQGEVSEVLKLITFQVFANCQVLKVVQRRWTGAWRWL